MSEPFYLSYLKTVFLQRADKNPSYSGRAFARSLELDPGALCRIMSRKQVPSFKAVKKLAEKLNINQEDQMLFFSSILDEHKRQVLSRLERTSTKNGLTPTSLKN